MAILGLFAVHKISAKSIKTYSENTVHGKNLCVHGEGAERLLAYSPNTPKDTKLSISGLLMVIHENFRSLLSIQDGLD